MKSLGLKKNAQKLTQLASTCGNSTACCLVTKPGSLLIAPPPLFSKPVAPPPPPLPPTHRWRKFAQLLETCSKHAQNTKHLD